MNDSDSICLDSNIFVRMLAPDEHTDSIQTLFHRLLEENRFIYGPSLVNFEVLKAMAKKEKITGLEASQIDTAMRDFFDLPILLVWNKPLADETMRLHRAGIRSVYDASFVALAKIRAIPLVTEDRELQNVGRRFYPEVYSIGEWLGLPPPTPPPPSNSGNPSGNRGRER